VARALPHDDLVPDLEEGVPGPRADRHPVLCDSETRHPVIVASKNTCPLSAECVPDVAVEIVIASEEKTTGFTECNTGDPADDIVMAVHAQLLVGPDVKHPTCRVVRPSCKSISIGEKLEEKV